MSKIDDSAKMFLKSEFKNYLDLGNTSENAFIYRVFPLNYFYELFSKDQNVLVSPKKWDDPYENYVLNAHVAKPSGEKFSYGFKNNYYGQCWTLRSYSDAMWRIYSPDHRSVRVRTTIRKLANSLASQQQTMKNDVCFIGKVKYQGLAALTKFASTIGASDTPSTVLYAKTLLRKRRAFSHEKEVRILYFDGEDQCDNEIYRYSIDPHQLFDQVMIDPRIDKEEFIDMRNAICRRTNFQGEICRSNLYDAPPGLIIP